MKKFDPSWPRQGLLVEVEQLGVDDLVACLPEREGFLVRVWAGDEGTSFRVKGAVFVPHGFSVLVVENAKVDGDIQEDAHDFVFLKRVDDLTDGA